MTILRFVVGSALAASAAFCQLKDFQGWDKVRWGMSVAEVRSAYGDRASEPTAQDSDQGRVLAALRAKGLGEDSEALKIYKQLLNGNPGPGPAMRLIVKDIHIGDITVAANIYAAKNSDSVDRVGVDAAGPASTAAQRMHAFRTLKPLLIQKYGIPKSEEQRPDLHGYVDSMVLWVFPSTSVTLLWSEGTNPQHDNGYVEIEYKAIDKKALDVL